jgi:hypothetical protein
MLMHEMDLMILSADSMQKTRSQIEALKEREEEKETGEESEQEDGFSEAESDQESGQEE